MKTTSLKLSVLASALLLAGCGGGSSSTDTSITSNNSVSKITGTVPGTLIEAFCTDGSYYKVSSTDNGTAEHPFEIEVPSTVSCSLVMTTNENDEDKKVITQIGVITPDAEGTVFKATGDIDLGYIPLAMDPSGVDENGDHVADNILKIQVDGTYIVVALDNPLDDDGDGLVNVYEDDDNDGIYNSEDDDDDGDHEIDVDNDSDDDGIDDDKDVDDDNDGVVDTVLPTTYTANAGRLLGSQCAQCHGTNGVSTNEWDSIAGEDNLLDEMFEDDEPIMSAQAHGYTSEEIILIENWLKTLKSND
jgi:cytochrome c553